LKQIQTKINSDSHGLHARPASAFVRIAATYPCEISVIRDDITVNGKSILGLMMLALGPGAEFSIVADGELEEEALDHLIKLIQNNFVI
jgi:phosphocarrier protein HPr